MYNDTLYLNFHPGIRARFLSDPDAHIKAGNERWISWWGKLHAGPFNTDCVAETWDDKSCMQYPQQVAGISPRES